MQALPAGSSLTSQLLLFRPRQSPADVDVHAVSVPARSFTGDFYYTQRHGERLWFTLGDVAGKGLNAAVLMATVRQSIRVAALQGLEPSAILAATEAAQRSVTIANRAGRRGDAFIVKPPPAARGSG